MFYIRFHVNLKPFYEISYKAGSADGTYFVLIVGQYIKKEE